MPDKETVDWIAQRYLDVVAERDELRAENERLRTALGESPGGKVDWIVRAEQLQAENERLRAELRTCQETLTACLESDAHA